MSGHSQQCMFQFHTRAPLWADPQHVARAVRAVPAAQVPSGETLEIKVWDYDMFRWVLSWVLCWVLGAGCWVLVAAACASCVLTVVLHGCWNVCLAGW